MSDWEPSFEAKIVAQFALDYSHIVDGYEWFHLVSDHYHQKFDVPVACYSKDSWRADPLIYSMFLKLDEHSDLYGHPYLDHDGMKAPEYKAEIMKFFTEIVDGTIAENKEYVAHLELVIAERVSREAREEKRRQFWNQILPWRCLFPK